MSTAHGTVTGAACGVLLRPYLRLNSAAGVSVTTYGEPRNMNRDLAERRRGSDMNKIDKSVYRARQI